MDLIRWTESWWSWWFIPKIIVFIIPLIVSSISLWIVIHDRRAKLILRVKKGTWGTLYRATHGPMFAARIDVYNISSRANAICDYRFYWKKDDGTEDLLESEQWEVNWGEDKPKEIKNLTPITLAPYSGSEVEVQAQARGAKQPIEMKVRIEIVDLFGNVSKLEITVENK